MTNEDLQKELDQAQIMLGFILNEVGPVTISLGRQLPPNSAIEVEENNKDNTLTVRLVSGQ